MPSIHAPAGKWTYNLGMCPNQGLNPQPFGVRDIAPTNWATPARAGGKFLRAISSYGTCKSEWAIYIILDRLQIVFWAKLITVQLCPHTALFPPIPGLSPPSDSLFNPLAAPASCLSPAQGSPLPSFSHWAALPLPLAMPLTQGCGIPRSALPYASWVHTVSPRRPSRGAAGWSVQVGPSLKWPGWIILRVTVILLTLLIVILQPSTFVCFPFFPSNSL